jgi:peptide/nickel transport system substrate-binding protein
MTWAMHFTLTPKWFDPAETGGLLTLTIGLYALHDALVKPMPDGPMAPCLATAWHESDDGLTYDFALRQGVKFQNGDAFTAEDVKFSFERYQGASAAALQQQVKAIEIVHPHHLRFVLHAPWPDFMTFYATTARPRAGLSRSGIPRRSATTPLNTPVGLGPYRVVRYDPGIELVCEAYPAYWRKTPR